MKNSLISAYGVRLARPVKLPAFNARTACVNPVQAARAADADASHAERRDIRNARATGADHQEVDRLRPNGLDERFDLRGIVEARSGQRSDRRRCGMSGAARSRS